MLDLTTVIFFRVNSKKKFSPCVNMKNCDNFICNIVYTIKEQ